MLRKRTRRFIDAIASRTETLLFEKGWSVGCGYNIRQDGGNPTFRPRGSSKAPAGSSPAADSRIESAADPESGRAVTSTWSTPGTPAIPSLAKPTTSPLRIAALVALDV